MLRRRSGDPRLTHRTRPAVLEGHARVAFRGTPYPTLLPRPGTRVPGWLIRPSPAALRRLVEYEGACYRLVPVRVRADGRLRWARAFVVPRRMADALHGWPMERKSPGE
ncbi:gamma-glutamylcyclotransferase [Roseomonas sp. OT10]|nr:gamma-glutamylcyclotransferase [Roseomonas sp. OT10]